MHRIFFIISTTILLVCGFPSHTQYTNADSTYKHFFIGSTAFLLGNLATTNPPEFFQINFGIRLSQKDVIAIEPKTWKYAWPNGIHPFFNKAYGKPNEKFPGYIREYGLSIAYQRFLLNGLYIELNVMPSLQHFINNKGNKIDNGFQIFNTYRIGYHIKFFKDRFFIQPSIAITHRAFHTTMPAEFKLLDDKWSKFVFGEPGFHFGFNF